MNNLFFFLFFLSIRLYSRSRFISYSFMAACVVEDTILPSIYYQATNSIKQTLNFHAHSNRMDSSKKRQLNRSNTFNSNNESIITVIDNSCSTEAVVIDNNNESMKCLGMK